MSLKFEEIKIDKKEFHKSKQPIEGRHKQNSNV